MSLLFHYAFVPLYMRKYIPIIYCLLRRFFLVWPSPLQGPQWLLPSIRWKTSLRTRMCLFRVLKTKFYIWPYFHRKNKNFRATFSGSKSFDSRGFNMEYYTLYSGIYRPGGWMLIVKWANRCWQIQISGYFLPRKYICRWFRVCEVTIITRKGTFRPRRQNFTIAIYPKI